MRRTPFFWALGVLVLAAAFPTRADAQTDATASQAVVAPWDAPVLRADAFTLRSNPATLAFLDGWHSGLAIRGDFDGDTTPALGWHSAYGFGRIGGLGIGLDRYGDSTAATWGFGIGAEAASVGFSQTNWFSDDRRDLDGFSTTRIAFASRPTSVFGFGFLIDNLMTPRLAGVPVTRTYVPTLALRTATGRFEVEFEGRFAEGDAPDAAGGTIVVRPIDGLRLFASTSVSLETGLDDSRVHGGVELTWGPLSMSAGAGVTQQNGESSLGYVTAFEVSTHGVPGFLARDRIVRIDLAGDFDETPSFSLRGASPVFTDLLVQLEALERDPRVGGVYLSMGGLTAGTGQLAELRAAIRRLQAEGKTVIAYLDQATMRDLYVAGAADVLIASPTLSVLTTGVGITRTYFGDLFAMFGVEAQFVRIGDYKSGPERFTDDGPSPESQAQVDAFLDDVWDTLRAGLAEDFGLSEDEVDAWMNEAPLFADDLLAAGHVDAVLYRDELPAEIDGLVGRPVHIVPYARPRVRNERWQPPNRVAVLHISGAIVQGTSGDSLFGYRTGDETIVNLARELAADAHLRGVIVRIDSPGGSAVASDRIHRALSQLAETVPVVVSMGDVAGSGGYYSAAFGTEIFATPTTLTGSIGIYAGTFALDGLLDRAGISRVRDERGGESDLFDGRGWDADALARVRAHIEHAYGIFLDRVAEGRGMTTEEVDALGQGRIWSGQAARENGLVDSTEGFRGALAQIRVDADLDEDAPVTLEHYPRPRASLMALLPSPTAQTNEELATLLRASGFAGLFEHAAALLAAPAGTTMAHIPWAWDGL